MKPTLTRRYRRNTSPAKSEGSIFKKDSQESFFGGTEHQTFFQPAAIQRKCEQCEGEDKKVNRLEEKKEEEKVMKMEEKKEEEKVQRQPEKKDEEKLQRAEDKKEDEKVMKMEDKKEEETVQKKESGNSKSVGKSVSNYIGSLNGKGQPLSHSNSNFFTARMGYDFSNVKVHTDKEAAASAKAINAKAYTVGNNIVFNEGNFNTESSEGKRLMAHELTHVIQQGDSDKNLQRAPGDKHDLTSTALSGNVELEKCFDGERSIGESAKGDHVKKIQEGLILLGISLPKFGANSDYGTETAKAVKEFQENAGMSKKEQDGIVGSKTIGLMDKSLRDGIISSDADLTSEDFVLKDPAKAAIDTSCQGKPEEKPCPDPDPDFDSSTQEAIDLIDKVIAEQLPPVKKGTTDYPAVFALLFRFNDTRPEADTVKEVKTNFEETKKFIELIKKDKSHVRCGTECDAGCKTGSPAQHNINVAGKHILTFCPDFNTEKIKDLIVLHECHHAAIGGSGDTAYASTRLIDKLDHAKALLNAESFHLYASMVKDPTKTEIGPSSKDSNSITDKTTKDKVDLALAFMEQWFTLVTYDLSRTATDMDHANTKGSYDALALWDVVDTLHKWLGTTPYPSKPSKKDVTKAKAVEERSLLMEAAFSKAFEIKESKDASSWERGPGKEIKLNTQVTDLDIHHLVIALLQELVHATPDISAEMEPLYVGIINEVRNRRNFDP